MIGKEPMRWNRWTIQPFLDVRVAVPDGTLEGMFRCRYPDILPAIRNVETTAAAWILTTLHALPSARPISVDWSRDCNNLLSLLIKPAWISGQPTPCFRKRNSPEGLK